MLIYSPQSSIMMIIILIMFILCELTDMVNGNYNLSVITASTLIKYGANYSLLVNAGQYWRLFTAMLLHGGLLHIISNSTSFFLYLMPV
jgi:rhomboid protease GluP